MKTKNYFHQKKLLFYLVIATLFMSIGYASLNSISLDVKGTATAKKQEDIYITDVSYVSDINANKEASEIINYYQTILNSKMVLSETDPNSEITYQITIYNSTNDIYYFDKVDYLLTENTYSNPNIVFRLDGLNSGDLLMAKESITFNITFSYKDKVLAENNILNSCLNFKFIKKAIYLKEYVLNQANEESKDIVIDDTADQNIRYKGQDPNNWVSFNGEMWRIIGLMNNIEDASGNKSSKIKIILAEFNLQGPWDIKTTGLGSSTSEYGSNDWTDSYLQKTLNEGAYWNNGYGFGPWGGNIDLTGLGLKAKTKEMLEPVVWNLGGVTTYNEIKTKTLYEEERGTNVYSNHSTDWTGYVGLMYPSDAGYATEYKECWAEEIGSWPDECYGYNWLAAETQETLEFPTFPWTITPYANTPDTVVHIGRKSLCNNTSYAACDGYQIHPAVYLKDNVVITSGTGTEEDPFVLKLDSDLEESNWDKIKHIWFGDSVMRGYGNNNQGFAEYMVNYTGADYYQNLSVSGAVLNKDHLYYNGSTYAPDPNMVIQNHVDYALSDENYENYKDVNLIILDGGGNDVIGVITHIQNQKEIGTVDETTLTPSDSYTLMSDLEKVLYTLRSKFPEAKILYVNPVDYTKHGMGEIVFTEVIKWIDLDYLNSITGNNFSSFEEAHDVIIQIYTEGLYDQTPFIKILTERYNQFISEVPKAIAKYGGEFMDLKDTIAASRDTYLQSDKLHITAAGYEAMTPIIIEKVEEMFSK